MTFNCFFFLKIAEIAQRRGVPLSRSPVCDAFELHKLSLLTTSSNLNNFGKLFNFWFKPTSLAKFWKRAMPRPRLLILHSAVSLSHKKSLFSKILDDVIACDLPVGPCPSPLIKNSGYASRLMQLIIFQNFRLTFYFLLSKFAANERTPRRRSFD